MGERITYAYDVLGNLTTKSADTTTSFEYDVAGRLTAATSPSSTLTYAYDVLGQVLAETVNGRTLTHAYDGLGRRVARTTPTGSASNWAYDVADNCTQLTASGPTIRFTHDLTGNELDRRIDETIALHHAFDALGRLTAQSVSTRGGHLVQQRAYTYRLDGALFAIDDHRTGIRRFELDRASRVTAVHAADWTETYAFDPAGNQTQANWPSDHPSHQAAGTRTYEGTRITRAGHIRYEHDELGRVTVRQKRRLSRKPDTWRYTWDAEDRLISTTTPDGTVWHYTYDPLGRRTAKLCMAADGETVAERTDFTRVTKGSDVSGDAEWELEKPKSSCNS
ncbi:hypothetical protein [Streptomyces sp. NPDC048436]|uniref:hypothetical protein n=1 Tax=Streptomyces sp. NPDC048436 TaxID=3365550 RepID=UPI0037245869